MSKRLTLDEIHAISEHCCNTDCARFRAGRCPYIGEDKVSCYLFQVARSEYESDLDGESIYVTSCGKKVIGVFHSLQRAKRCVEHLENLDGYKITEERVLMSDGGGIYHMFLHSWEYHGQWWKTR